jgi:Bacterial SH3 domain
MKKIYLGLLIFFAISAAPALAATKATWKPAAPSGYTAINWASAPGIASFFKAPADNGAIDFLTRIYLPQNQINFIISTTTPIDLNSAASSSAAGTATSSPLLRANAGTAPTDISTFDDLSFKRIGAEAAKTLDPSIKFLWDVSFFNMKPVYSDLSLAVKYTFGATTTITGGSRSAPDMQQQRRMLIINNQAGTSSIKDFDSAAFTGNTGDQALEGFAPTVAKTDNSTAGASRLFLGVSNDGRELEVYCSQLATVKEASDALTAAGVPVDHQLEADGGASAACGYNLPGQFFVEPTRSLPLLMGAKTILARAKVTAKLLNVRSGPSTKYPIVTKLPKGTAVLADEENNGWYRIGLGEWISKTLIK